MVTLNQLEALSIGTSESNFLCHLLELDRSIIISYLEEQKS